IFGTLTLAVRGAHDLSHLQTASANNEAHRVRPMVATRLSHASLRAHIVFEARRAAEFAGNSNQAIFIKASRINVVDKSLHRLVIDRNPHASSVKNVTVDGVRIPVVNPLFQPWASGNIGVFHDDRDKLAPRLNESSCHECSVAPGMLSIPLL